jgi:hypothetical protein
MKDKPSRAKLVKALHEIAIYVLPVYTDEQGRQRVPLEFAERPITVARKALGVKRT